MLLNNSAWMVRENSNLEEAHRAAQRKKAADRIKTILLLNKGLSYTQIAEILMLDQTTARRYEHEYHQTGIDGLLEDHYQGSVGSLTDEQEQALTVYLKTSPHSIEFSGSPLAFRG
jgi:transposase